MEEEVRSGQDVVGEGIFREHCGLELKRGAKIYPRPGECRLDGRGIDRAVLQPQFYCCQQQALTGRSSSHRLCQWS